MFQSINFNLSRDCLRVAERVSVKMAQALLSRLGRLKWCASKTIMVKYVRPVGVQNLKGVVRIESARRCQTA
nr:MAG TPA: hypothetical protein [Caudoviricetes sp.]